MGPGAAVRGLPSGSRPAGPPRIAWPTRSRCTASRSASRPSRISPGGPARSTSTIPGVSDAVATWLDRGGALAFVGAEGTGRSHVVGRIANELAARGTACLHWVGGISPPWLLVEDGLRSARLPGAPAALPEIADLHRRAEIAARRLAERAHGRLVLLVDDADRLDPGTRETAAILARRGAAVLWTGATAPPGTERVVALRPLDLPRAAALVAEWLRRRRPGPSPPSRCAAWAGGRGAWSGSSSPRSGTARSAGSTGGGSPTGRRSRRSRPPTSGARPPSADGLSAGAARLGALVARVQPVERSVALALADASEQDLLELRAGWVHGESWLVSASTARADALAAAVVLDRGVFDRLVRHRLASDPVPWHALGGAIALAGDAELAATFGPGRAGAPRAGRGRRGAGRRGICGRSRPRRNLAAERLEALAQAGRADEARAFAAPWLEGRPVDPAVVPALLR